MTAVVERFRRVVSERFGWRLDTDADRLSALLASRAGAAAEAYVDRVAALAPGDPELRALAQALAVSETYFFRNREQFDALEDIILPSLAAGRLDRPIRLLSAACASGEEPYSLAISYLRVRARRPVPPVQIVGIDISARAIERARANRYSRWALRGMPPHLVDLFFDRVDTQFAVKPEVASLVRFEEGNLLQDLGKTPGPWDAIFFRNACMYFTVDAARAIVARLARSLAPDGYLFLGHAENLRGISEAFELHHTHEAFYYRRRDGAALDEAAGPRVIVPGVPAAALPAPADIAGDGDDDAWFHEIGRATERIASIVDGVRRQPPPAAGAEPPRSAAPLALLAEERFAEALDLLGDADDADRRELRAVLLTQLGRFDDARQEAERLLAADPLHAGAHYVLALADERAGHLASAAWHDEMAAHLDPSFAMPHMHLGILARRRGDADASVAHMREARELLVREDGARLLLFGGGFGRAVLLRLCESQAGGGGTR